MNRGKVGASTEQMRTSLSLLTLTTASLLLPAAALADRGDQRDDRRDQRDERRDHRDDRRDGRNDHGRAGERLSANVGGLRIDATAGRSRGGAYLQIEGRGHGTQAFSWMLPELTVDGRRVRIDQVRRIDLVRFGQGRLIFDARLARGDVRCGLAFDSWVASCRPGTSGHDGDYGDGGGYDGGGYSGGGYSGGGYSGGYDNMDGLRELTRACDNAFIGRDDEARCVQVARHLGGAAAAAIASCDRAFIGTEATLRCVQAIDGRAGFDATIEACDRTFIGEESTLQCLSRMQNSGLPTEVVAACDRAFIGEDATLRCLSAVRGSRYQPVELIRYCDEQTIGEADALQCLAQTH